MIQKYYAQNNVYMGQVNKQSATPGLSFVIDTAVAVFAVNAQFPQQVQILYKS